MTHAMDELRSIVMRAENKWTGTGISRVAMVRAEACADQVYQPMLHFVLQGSKTLSIGSRVSTYQAGTYFLVPVDVPATGEIQAGGPGLPYLAVSLTLEPVVLASLLLEGVNEPEQANEVCFGGVLAPAEMTDAWLRMLRLIDHPREIAMLSPMIEREILFRAIQGPLGGWLKDIARPDGRLAHIRRAIHWIREHYNEPIFVEQLAALTDMSVAAFYRHFKAITAMTPIQYQKRLRLLRARWLLLFEPRDAASIAFAVGYESASQFNREYARLFGLPPARDMARFKAEGQRGAARGQAARLLPRRDSMLSTSTSVEKAIAA
ncbi:MAG: AraC family transcriptional regulator [Variovorax sp.]|nr:MAG: AraC family transcriptional regulator [Variovorax sp.]